MDYELPKTQNNTFEFNGYPSGDCESFCWDVDKETFIKIKGMQPDKYDESISRTDFYRIYPNDFYGIDKPMCKMKLAIEVIEK